MSIKVFTVSIVSGEIICKDFRHTKTGWPRTSKAAVMIATSSRSQGARAIADRRVHAVPTDKVRPGFEAASVRCRIGIERLYRILVVKRLGSERPHIAIRVQAGTTSAKRSSGCERTENALERSWDRTKRRVHGHLFRIWTACAVLAAYGYGWFYAPEMLTWWKRTTEAAVEAGCGLLPYPWGDRLEATIGNFGLWVQIALAITLFRILAWLLISAVRRVFAPRASSAIPPAQCVYPKH
jgi:hypothetical protein